MEFDILLMDKIMLSTVVESLQKSNINRPREYFEKCFNEQNEVHQ